MIGYYAESRTRLNSIAHPPLASRSLLSLWEWRFASGQGFAVKRVNRAENIEWADIGAASLAIRQGKKVRIWLIGC